MKDFTDPPKPAQRPTTNRFTATPFDPGLKRIRTRDSLGAFQALMGPDDLSVVFQPIVYADTLQIFAYEALVRCRVPQFKNPIVLFDRAVADGCCGRLGRMMREVAVPLCAGHKLFLNAHPNELQERWLVRTDDPMFFHDQEVFLEVTESVPLTHFELCRDVLREVRARSRVKLVVDDLGAGYSNFKRIADLEPEIVKLDRGLIMGIQKNSRQQTLVRGVVRMCTDLGARVVAEGIETHDEWSALRDTGVHLLQGYLFARPGFPLPVVDPTLTRTSLTDPNGFRARR